MRPSPLSLWNPILLLGRRIPIRPHFIEAFDPQKMNFLFRRSSSISASASRRTPAALVSLESSLLIPTHSVAPFSCVAGGCLSFFTPFPAENIGFRSARCREFHFLALPLRFRATDVTRADYAFDNYEEDKDSSKRGSDELEIAKLGISQDIVTQLANRGITKLFPMQVLRCLCRT